VNPVIAIALGVIVLDEAVTARIVAGAVLILIAVAIVVRRESEAGEIIRPDGHAPELAPARRS
jgi:drug/metabolite transporter (DMT)-like permease